MPVHFTSLYITGSHFQPLPVLPLPPDKAISKGASVGIVAEEIPCLKRSTFPDHEQDHYLEGGVDTGQ